MSIALRLATAIYWASLLISTHLPPKNVPNTHVNDKVEHFITYGLLTALLAACLGRSKLPGKTFLFTLIAIVLCYGALDEWTQPIFGRTCDIDDWLADASAATTVALIATAIRAGRAAVQPSGDSAE